MIVSSNLRRHALSAMWAFGGVLVAGNAVYEINILQHRAMDHHVRDYAGMAYELTISFGMLCLAQIALLYIGAGWARIASRAISVLVLAITVFELLMAFVTSAIGSLVPAIGNVCLLLGSLMSLAMKPVPDAENASIPTQPGGEVRVAAPRPHFARSVMSRIRALISVLVLIAVTLFGAFLAIFGTVSIQDVASRLELLYELHRAVRFSIEYVSSLILYFGLAWLIAIIARSRAFECNIAAGALANMVLAAFVATSTKPLPASLAWAEVWTLNVFYYLPALSVFPAFLLVGWLMKRKYTTSKSTAA